MIQDMCATIECIKWIELDWIESNACGMWMWYVRLMAIEKTFTYLYSVYAAIRVKDSQPFLAMCSTLSMGNYNYNFFLMCDTARTCFFAFALSLSSSSSCYLYFLSIWFFRSLFLVLLSRMNTYIVHVHSYSYKCI